MTKPNPLFVSIVCWVFLALPARAQDVPAPQTASASATNPDAFFTAQVLPILATRCWECHGEEVQESDLRLDSRAGVLAGGSSGTALVVAGKPESSYLIQVVRQDADVAMPPGEKLSPAEIDILSQWVSAGTPWPSGARVQLPTKEELRAEQIREHWALQPIAAPPPPSVRNPAWISQGIDQYILARLEQQQLAPSPPADRYTLIRRLKFDLLGLPPTHEEVAAFVADPSSDAYARLVDRYLSSPHYGERWGRHWLDVARYADTKGYAFTRDRRYPFAYTYRDYVIRAWNEDLPYDQFLLEQLAADLLGRDSHDPSLAALGFLTVGRKYNNRHLDIDDQIDVVGRGLLGLTLACARCHDHKFDPIPTEDYYSLYGVFASSTEPDELPVIGRPEETPGYEQYARKLAELQGNLDQFLVETRDEIAKTAQLHATDYLARVLTREREEALQQLPFIELKGESFRVKLVAHWQRALAERATADHPVLGPLFELSRLPDEHYDERALPILRKWRAAEAGIDPGRLNPLVQEALHGETALSKLDLARIYGRLFTSTIASSGASENALDDTDPHTAPPRTGIAEQQGERPAALQQAAADQVRELFVGPGSLTDLSPQDVVPLLTRAEGNRYRELQRQIEAHQVDSPGSPPRAMVLRESPVPHDPRVFVRGNPARVGDAVPRQFLCALDGPDRQPFKHSSGRLELARRIVDPANPLTARVIVNRVWMHHFGTPLVRTPSDFGVRSKPPVQQDVLDFLAHQLIHDNWSLKRLHRSLVLSSCYQQASLRRPDAEQVDPENEFYWRMNPRRLEFEALHDALLAVSGQLDVTMGGRPVKITEPPYARRRAVYGYIDRQDLPGLYRVFDLASPDQSCPQRAQTTVPQQALFFMNSPFVAQCAEQLLTVPDVEAAATLQDRIEALYRATLARIPTAAEREIAARLLAGTSGHAAGRAPGNTAQHTPPEPTHTAAPDGSLDASGDWQAYAQLLLMSNAFLFVD